jgi:hypothetical protein
MKNDFLKLLILVLMLNWYSARGQSNEITAHYKYGNIELWKFFNKKFEEEAKKINLPSCIISAVFAKFKIDSAGNVKIITFSDLKGTPQVFRNILTSIVLATNGSWVPTKINGKFVESKPFILPLIYEMEAGCNPTNVSGTNTYRPVPNRLDVDLLYILDFEDSVGSHVNQLDCILLRPLRIVSAN